MTITFTTKTADVVRDDILRTQSNALRARGVATPNVSKGSDDYNWAQAVANELECVYANLPPAADAVMPDTTTGDELRRWLALFGLSIRAAGPSRGFIVYETSSPALVGTGQQLLDPSGNTFAVSTGGLYADGDSIPVQSVAVGSATNLAAATVLRWVSPPPYASPNASLDSDGASNGVDVETEESARQRLLDVLASPSGSGNASLIAARAENADSSIEKAYVYPAANGPGTEHAAVAGFASASLSRSRMVSAAAIANATSEVTAELPEHTELVVTGCEDQTADVSFILRMPAATTAVPAGTGGGFVDAAPFPSVTGATNKFMRATVVTSSTNIRVESMAAPTVGQSISWIDRDTYTIHTALILTVATNTTPSGGTPGTYTITLDKALVATTGTVIAANSDYVFPASANAQNYLDAVLDAFADLGPGEKTTSAGLLPHAYRQPRYFESHTYELGDQFLRALVDSGSEVLSATWGYQNGGTTTPSIPMTINDAPAVFVPGTLGFYAP